MRRRPKILLPALGAALVASLLAATSPAVAQSPLDLLFGRQKKHRHVVPHRPAPTAKPLAETKPAEAAKPKPSEQKPKAAGRDVKSAEKPKPASVAPAVAGPPAYEPQLTRLAEVMGGLTFLRDICQAGDGEDWREKMTALLNADAPSGPRREKLIAAYNRGFRGYELTYRACTPNAETVIARYLKEAERIALDMSYRYGAQ